MLPQPPQDAFARSGGLRYPLRVLTRLHACGVLKRSQEERVLPILRDRKECDGYGSLQNSANLRGAGG